MDVGRTEDQEVDREDPQNSDSVVPKGDTHLSHQRGSSGVRF